MPWHKITQVKVSVLQHLHLLKAIICPSFSSCSFPFLWLPEPPGLLITTLLVALRQVCLPTGGLSSTLSCQVFAPFHVNTLCSPSMLPSLMLVSVFLTGKVGSPCQVPWRRLAGQSMISRHKAKKLSLCLVR